MILLGPAFQQRRQLHQENSFEQFQNFRPISNLKVVSKLVDRAVAIQLTDHVIAHHLDETFQSAYKNFHSTETALVRVQNDILCAIAVSYTHLTLPTKRIV